MQRCRCGCSQRARSGQLMYSTAVRPACRNRHADLRSAGAPARTTSRPMVSIVRADQIPEEPPARRSTMTTHRPSMGIWPLACRLGTLIDALLVSVAGHSAALPHRGDRLFLRLARSAGLRGDPDGPRIHDLRHTFAVRSSRACRHDRDAVARHVVRPEHLSRPRARHRHVLVPARDADLDGADRRGWRGAAHGSAPHDRARSAILPLPPRASARTSAGRALHTCATYALQLPAPGLLRGRAGRTIKPCQLEVEQLDAPLILAFLEHIESRSAATRPAPAMPGWPPSTRSSASWSTAAAVVPRPVASHPCDSNEEDRRGADRLFDA